MVLTIVEDSSEAIEEIKATFQHESVPLKCDIQIGSEPISRLLHWSSRSNVWSCFVKEKQTPDVCFFLFGIEEPQKSKTLYPSCTIKVPIRGISPTSGVIARDEAGNFYLALRKFVGQKGVIDISQFGRRDRAPIFLKDKMEEMLMVGRVDLPDVVNKLVLLMVEGKSLK